MSALGDIVHALPVLAAIATPRADIDVDWLADRKYAPSWTLSKASPSASSAGPACSESGGRLRSRASYDVAIDLQGLLSRRRWRGSPARLASSASSSVRCASAPPAWFYNESAAVPPGAHVVQKNLAVAAALGLESPAIRDSHSRAAVGAGRRGDRERCGDGASRIRADQSRRGLAEQALAARALRCVGAARSRSCMTARPSCCGAGTSAISPTGSSPPRGSAAPARAETSLGDVLALVCARLADGVWRHRAAASGGGRRHAGRRSVRAHVARAQRAVARRRCRGVARRSLRVSSQAALPRAA